MKTHRNIFFKTISITLIALIIQGCSKTASEQAPTAQVKKSNSAQTAASEQISNIHSDHYQDPKLLVTVVIDQFAYHYLKKVKPYLTGGLKFLMDNAVCYHNAHHPHGTPSTAPGHTGLSTGTYADTHGIVDNSWMDQDGRKVVSIEDSSPDAAVIAPSNQACVNGLQNNKFHNYGRSADHIKVDTFSDQFMLYSTPANPHHAVSISLKDRAAICMGGRIAKPFWLDEDNGVFTSSKAFFNTLPEWINSFNQTHALKKGQNYTWKTIYPEGHNAYSFDQANNYSYSGYKFPLIGKEITIDFDKEDPCDLYEKTPFANELLMNLAKHYITTNVDAAKPDRHSLWVSFSSLDKLGHFYGPYSREIIDMIYQLDLQLKELIEFAQKAVGKENVLFVLSADHGVMPIPEILQKQGMSLAHRILEQDICAALNKEIENKHSIKGLIDHFNTPAFNFDKKIYSALLPEKRKAVIATIKDFLLRQPGFQKVWTFDELYNLPAKTGTIDYNFKRQLFKNRSGEIICRLQPYVQITKYKTGTTHSTPYGYDTQVPLFIYQAGHIEKKQVYKRVTTLQLVPTLANIMKIPKPSAAHEKPLPYIPLD